MVLKTKTVAISVAFCLAVAGGVYALTAGGAEAVAPSQERIASDHALATKADPGSPQLTSATSGNMVDTEDANPPLDRQTVSQNQPNSQAPKKLTKQQVTPRAATQEEKLQQAAEQESRF